MRDLLLRVANIVDRLGQHFVAFIKEDGRLWELEGSRVSIHLFTISCLPFSAQSCNSTVLKEPKKGPIDRGALAPEEDVLSPRAIELGIGRVIKMEKESGGSDLRFSCIALAKSE
jgi:ubiquitin carboxyl-terminal hydrolase L3